MTDDPYLARRWARAWKTAAKNGRAGEGYAYRCLQDATEELKETYSQIATMEDTVIEKRTPNRTAQIVLKMRPHELDLLKRAAEQTGMWVSEFARNAIVETLKNDGFLEE